jgi:hypothetical protein
MKKDQVIIEPINKPIDNIIQYQLAVEKSGFVQGFLNAARGLNTNQFESQFCDSDFVDAVNILCQFVRENHPHIFVTQQLPVANIEDMLEELERK